MKKFLLLAAAATLIVGCSQKRELVDVYQGPPGQDGTSCSVAPEMSDESQIGSRISCTDGSFAIVLNGANGVNGTNGIDGQNGADAEACQAYRVGFLSTTFLKCPGQWPVPIFDGEDGEDGKDGKSCSVAQLNNGAKITCGSGYSATHAYVYNGQTGAAGAAGTSCTVSRDEENNRAVITCGQQVAHVYDGSDGAQGVPGLPGTPGQPGAPGQNGTNGTNGVDSAVLDFVDLDESPSCKSIGDGYYANLGSDADDKEAHIYVPKANCPSGWTLQTSGSNAGLCKKNSGSQLQAPTIDNCGTQKAIVYAEHVGQGNGNDGGSTFWLSPTRVAFNDNNGNLNIVTYTLTILGY